MRNVHTSSFKSLSASESNINVFFANDSLKIKTRILDASRLGNLKIITNHNYEAH